MMDKCLINYEVLHGFEKQYIKNCNYMRKYLKLEKYYKCIQILKINTKILCIISTA